MRKLFSVLSLVVLGATIFSSCYTPPEPGSATITVRDQNGLLVPSASIRFIQDGAPFPQGIPYIDETHMSDLEGRYTYIHHNNLQVTLDLIVDAGNLHGENIVTIYPDRHNNKDVIVYP